MRGRSIGHQSPEDVAHEALIAVCRLLPRFQAGDQQFMALVNGIVRHKVKDAYRAAAQDPAHAGIDDIGSTAVDGDPEIAAILAANRLLLLQLLDKLGEEQREVLVLRIAVGYTVEETARTLGSSPGAVRVTQHRALTRLRALISRRLTGGGA